MLQVTNVPLVNLDVTPDIASKLRFMVSSGVFDMRGGSVTLNFAPNGELKSIKKEIFIHNNGFDASKGAMLTV